MKTDDLVALLATGAGSVESNAAARRYAASLGWGAFGATLLMAILIGVRPDIDTAALLRRVRDLQVDLGPLSCRVGQHPCSRERSAGAGGVSFPDSHPRFIGA